MPSPERTAWKVRLATVADITPMIYDAWADLETRAVEANAYLSPHFVLPALRHLDAGAPIVIALVERGPTLVGVAVFRDERPSQTFPLPHLAGYRSMHSFLGGVLVDRQHLKGTVSALFDELHALRWRWHAVSMSGVWVDGPLYEAWETEARGRGWSFEVAERRQRAQLFAGQRTTLVEEVLQARDKQQKRNMRKLGERGTVSWGVLRGFIPDASVEAFLALEHLGWKGQEGTSLRSNAGEEAFFREMTANFGRAGRALFFELKLDGRIIASTSNFISGDAGFAFKVGWLPELAKLSPGVLNEVETLRAFQQGECRDLAWFDSGATEGSYIDSLWLGRRTLGSTITSTSALGAAALGTARLARAFRRRVVRSREPA
jgi:hypothetical protein